MKKNKILWIIILLIGLIPFIIAFGFGICAAINGMPCIDDCIRVVGINAFVSMIVLYSLVFWPTYIVGLILIILSIFKIKK